MNRTTLLGIILIMVAATALLWYRTYKSSPLPASTETIQLAPSPSSSTLPIKTVASSTSAVEPRIAIDLYPLYTGATWNRAVAKESTMGTTTYKGAYMTSAVINADMDPGKFVTPFTQYYDALLKAHGWHVANDLAADGHTGGQIGYRNGPGTILVGFTIDYQSRPENAPSECPCTVSFSLFSSGAGD